MALLSLEFTEDESLPSGNWNEVRVDRGGATSDRALAERRLVTAAFPCCDTWSEGGAGGSMACPEVRAR